jgi:hypothetical protein
MAQENDVVLLHFEDQPLAFARIEAITPDHKPGWYHTKLLLLQLPLQPVTWILRDVYIDGEEFTMGGKRMRLEPVVCPDEPSQEEVEKQPESPPQSPSSTDNVISLVGAKKGRPKDEPA